MSSIGKSMAAIICIPHLYIVIIPGGRDDTIVLRRPGCGASKLLVRKNMVTLVCIPDLGVLIGGRRDSACAIGRPCHSTDRRCMPAIDKDKIPSNRTPYLHGLVDGG